MKIVKVLSISMLMGLSVLSINAMDSQELLDEAIKKNDTKLVQGALNSGASINKSFKSIYPLIRAVTFGKIDMVKFLLDHNADVNIRDSQKMTPLHYAAARKDDSILELLLQSKASTIFKDVDGETVLHVAAKYGNLDAVKDLIKSNAGLVLETDNEGRTALDLAKKTKRKEVVDYLEEVK